MRRSDREMNQTTKNMAAAGRSGSGSSDARLVAHVQVETTHGASSPSQLGKYHQRNGSARSSARVLSPSMAHHPAAAQILGTKTRPPTTAAVNAATDTAAEPQSLACLMSGSVSRETRSARRSSAVFMHSAEITSPMQNTIT